MRFLLFLFLLWLFLLLSFLFFNSLLLHYFLLLITLWSSVFISVLVLSSSAFVDVVIILLDCVSSAIFIIAVILLRIIEIVVVFFHIVVIILSIIVMNVAVLVSVFILLISLLLFSRLLFALILICCKSTWSLCRRLSPSLLLKLFNIKFPFSRWSNTLCSLSCLSVFLQLVIRQSWLITYKLVVVLWRLLIEGYFHHDDVSLSGLTVFCCEFLWKSCDFIMRTESLDFSSTNIRNVDNCWHCSACSSHDYIIIFFAFNK